MELFSPQYVDELGRLSQRALFEYSCFVETLRELPEELSGGVDSPFSCWEEADESLRIAVEASTQLEMHQLDERLREALQSVKPPGSAYIVRAPRSTSGNADQQLIRFQSIYCAIEFAMQSLKQFQYQLEHLIAQLKPVKNPNEWQALAGQLIKIGSEDLISLSWEHPDFPKSVASYRLESEMTWLAQLVNGNSSAVCEVMDEIRAKEGKLGMSDKCEAIRCRV